MGGTRRLACMRTSENCAGMHQLNRLGASAAATWLALLVIIRLRG